MIQDQLQVTLTTAWPCTTCISNNNSHFFKWKIRLPVRVIWWWWIFYLFLLRSILRTGEELRQSPGRYDCLWYNENKWRIPSIISTLWNCIISILKVAGQLTSINPLMTHGNELSGEIKLLNRARQVKTWKQNSYKHSTWLSIDIYSISSQYTFTIPLQHQVDFPSIHRGRMCKKRKELG